MNVDDNCQSMGLALLRLTLALPRSALKLKEKAMGHMCPAAIIY